MDIQFQIRQNAMEMQEYMKDLFDWQKSIKKKERALKASAYSSDKHASSGPAPRGRASGAVAPPPGDLMKPALGPKGPTAASPKANSTLPATQTTPSAAADERSAAAHTYTSYGKWDKFDVDAALASDDDDDSAPAKSSKGTRKRGSDTAEPLSCDARAPASATASPAPAPSPADPAPNNGSAATNPPPPGGLGSITISSRDPAAQPQEELLKPVATTRLTKAAADASTAATAAAAESPQAAAQLPTLPPIRNAQPVTADAWRARGNDLFKAGEYDSAFECYSRSVELQPTCLGHANRAMALLKLGRCQEAVEDCTAAISLDPSYVKAYQRRAAAHRHLGASLEAARDWEQALRLEPENRSTAADRDAALELLLSEQKLQPPLRRTAVPVQWVLPPPPPPPPPAAAAAAPLPPPKQPQEAPVAVEVTGVGGADAALPGAAAASPQPVVQPPPAPAAPDGVTATAMRGAAAAAASAAVAAAASGSRGVPRTSVDFEAAWRSMAGDVRRQAAYLAAIPPAALPSIFKNSLTAPVLASLVRCLLAGLAPAAPPDSSADANADAGGPSAAGSIPAPQGVSLLEALTRVARFDLMAMSIPSKERQALKAEWEGLLGRLRRCGDALEGGGSSCEAAAPAAAPVTEAAAAATALASLRQKYRL